MTAGFSYSGHGSSRHRSYWRPDTTAAPGSADDPVALVSRNADVDLNNFLRDPEMTWFRDNLPSARGVLIVPQFVRAGFIFGGAGGNGSAAGPGQSGQL